MKNPANPPRIACLMLFLVNESTLANNLHQIGKNIFSTSYLKIGLWKRPMETLRNGFDEAD
jgi:hypothetical protein